MVGFVARSINKGAKSVSCGNILGTDSVIEMKIDGISPLECQSFLDMINRGGFIKPSDIVYSSCVVAWDVYSRIMESSEAKSYFLSCKMQRNVFLKVVMIETHMPMKIILVYLKLLALMSTALLIYTRRFLLSFLM